MERFPCFATWTPAPATTKAAAVETLKVPETAGENGRGMSAHRRGKADKFIDRLPLHAQRGEQRRDQRVVCLTGEYLLHRGFGFDARKVLFRNEFGERFVDH
jgi:hypothetical protein